MSLPEKTGNALANGRKGFGYSEDGAFVSADGRDAVNLFALITLHSALKLEVRTGMKFGRVNTLRKANEMLGTAYRRKTQALTHLERVLREAGELAPELKAGTITPEEFEDYGVIENTLRDDAGLGGAMFETYGIEHEHVLSQKKRHVWTYADTENGGLVIQSGYHLVNRIGYLITKHPWTEHTEVIVEPDVTEL